MKEQIVLTGKDDYSEVTKWLRENDIHKLLLVHGASMEKLEIGAYFRTLEERTGIRVIHFTDFQPNPLYESAVKGVQVFHEERCDAIAAVGGGSAMDVAKCIKLYSNMDPEQNYLKQEIVPNDIPFLAMPTTAGTGSEATRYAVIYFQGAKQSVTSESCIPDAVILDSSALKNLPEYHRKATMLDALSHALEAFWSVNSTEESKNYSKEAIRTVFANKDRYLANEDDGNEAMLTAANLAGKAINISRTTAGHAMCYKITSLFGAAHGHAAALVNRKLFPWMLENTGRCIDPRGEDYLIRTFSEIAEAFGCAGAKEAADKLEALYDSLGLFVPAASEEEFAILKTSVNPERMKNHPVGLDLETIDALYHQILGVKEKS